MTPKKTPIRFKIITTQEAEEAFLDNPMPNGWQDEYLRTRPRILTDIDIFCENIRSKKQKMKDFSLFERVYEDGPDIVYVFSIYLELFEFNGRYENIIKCVDYFSKKYKNNIIVFQWNHDNDYSKYGSIIEKYNNVRIVNFGYTSKLFQNCITVPFWNYNTNPIKEEKKVFASFYGSANNLLRQTLVNNINNWNGPEFVYGNNLSPNRYYKKISESIFSLCPRGGPSDGGFSYRFFECMHLNTVPVIMVDKLIFPYTHLDWTKLCIRLPEYYVNDLALLKNALKKEEERVPEILDYIRENRYYFSLYGVQHEIYSNVNYPPTEDR